MFFRKNLHLILSVIIVVPAAFIYGFNPGGILSWMFDFQLESTDLKNVFKAIMCLYLDFSIVWILGMFRTDLWKTATVLNLVFMGGLCLGRTLGVVLDGIPSAPFAYGLVGEGVLAVFAIYQLRKFMV